MTFLGVILDDFFFPKDGLLLPLTPHIVTVLFIFLLIFNICITHTAAPGGTEAGAQTTFRVGSRHEAEVLAAKRLYDSQAPYLFPVLARRKA